MRQVAHACAALQPHVLRSYPVPSSVCDVYAFTSEFKPRRACLCGRERRRREIQHLPGQRGRPKESHGLTADRQGRDVSARSPFLRLRHDSERRAAAVVFGVTAIHVSSWWRGAGVSPAVTRVTRLFKSEQAPAYGSRKLLV